MQKDDAVRVKTAFSHMDRQSHDHKDRLAQTDFVKHVEVILRRTSTYLQKAFDQSCYDFHQDQRSSAHNRKFIMGLTAKYASSPCSRCCYPLVPQGIKDVQRLRRVW
mmetsp:Transcript_7590/g.20580  ORF Transcript_7590/g.20580 Transcript_7590/m.20580 type:complete len:107 (+) Transcript_7590:346-666(+)